MTATLSPLVQLRPPRRTVELKIDGQAVQVPEGTTVLEACQAQGKEIPVELRTSLEQQSSFP